MKRRLLVTGGAGFIGANFTRYWLERHPRDRLLVLDLLTYAGNLESLRGVETSPGFRFVRGDVRDQALVETLLGEERIDTIVHLAAETHVDRSIDQPGAFVEVNAGGTQTLLEAARRIWLEGPSPPARHRFHHVSTDEVYGSLEAGDPGFTETTPYAPRSPYAASKAAADHLVRAYHHTYGLEVTVSNCSNNYGPYQYPEKLIPLFLVRLLRGQQLPLYGDGLNVRDWLHVEDHCRGLERVLQAGLPGESYNLGGGDERTNLETVRLLCRLVDEAFAADPALAGRFPEAPPAAGRPCDSLLRFVTDRPGHDRRYAIDPARARRELGFETEISFEAGLRTTVDWYLHHEAWWRGER